MISQDDLQPLGLLAIAKLSAAPDRAVDALRPLIGGLDPEEAPKVAAYLRNGAVVLAIMEHTTDLIDSRFSVPGGSGIQTDGRYFWRADAADYVEHYRVRLPYEFCEYGRSRRWVGPKLSPGELAEADRLISDFYRGSFDESLWPGGE